MNTVFLCNLSGSPKTAGIILSCCIKCNVSIHVPHSRPFIAATSQLYQQRKVNLQYKDIESKGGDAVPKVASPSLAPYSPPTEPVTLHLVQLLEKLSLVDIANKEGVRSLNYTISLADRLRGVDTKGVEPYVSVLEDRSLPLFDDELDDVGDVNEHKDALLNCAADTLEDCFVVSSGNIDYVPTADYYKNLDMKQQQEEEEEETRVDKDNDKNLALDASSRKIL